VAYDNGAALHKPITRIISILRSSGWPGLEEVELNDLNVVGQAAHGVEDMEVDIEIVERKSKPKPKPKNKNKKHHPRPKGQMLGEYSVTRH
jgi:hypothetical protein